MNHSKKIVLLAAVLCILVGLALMIGASSSLWYADPGYLSKDPYIQNTYEFIQPVSSIQIRVSDADVTLLPTEGETCKVVCNETEARAHTVALENGVLSVIQPSLPPVWFSFGFHSGPAVTVYLPEGAYQALSLQNASGNLDGSGDFTFQTVRLTTSSGSISFSARASQSIDAAASSGDITLESCQAESLTVSATSGDIELLRCQAEKLAASASSGCISIREGTVTGPASAETTSGDLSVTDFSSAAFSAQTSSGMLTLSNACFDGLATLKATSGDVLLRDADAGEFSISTSSGDVTGTLLSGKLFHAETSSGDIHLPGDDSSGGNCEISTTSGDIDLSLREP